MAEEAIAGGGKPESQEICFIPVEVQRFCRGASGVGGVSGSFRYADGTYLGPHRDSLLHHRTA